MFDIGGGELLLIILVFVILFGPGKVPEMVRTMKKGVSKVREAQEELKKQVNSIEEEILDDKK